MTKRNEKTTTIAPWQTCEHLAALGRDLFVRALKDGTLSFNFPVEILDKLLDLGIGHKKILRQSGDPLCLSKFPKEE